MLHGIIYHINPGRNQRLKYVRIWVTAHFWLSVTKMSFLANARSELGDRLVDRSRSRALCSAIDYAVTVTKERAYQECSVTRTAAGSVWGWPKYSANPEAAHARKSESDGYLHQSGVTSSRQVCVRFDFHLSASSDHSFTAYQKSDSRLFVKKQVLLILISIYSPIQRALSFNIISHFNFFGTYNLLYI